jgi:periplasmic divalent cation tolerance protein
MPQAVILYTTWPDAEKAEAVGAEAVAQRLAACCNVFAPIRSIYRWQGEIERAAEVPMTFKTSAERAEALRDFLLERHPYDLPCILALSTDPGLSHADFVAWVSEETTPGPI